jgi:plastocyanin
MTHNQPPVEDPLTGEVRFRVPLPLLIPLAAVAVIAVVTVGISRVLLSIPPEAATTVALAVAINVLVAAAILASRHRLRPTSFVEMAIVVIYPILIGVVIAQLGIGGGGHGAEAEEAAPAEAAAPADGPVQAGGTVATENFEFVPDEIVLARGKDNDITLDNQDTAPHNIYIYPDEAAVPDAPDALFQGEDVPPGESLDYTISGLKTGEYPFICQIHPSMTGTVTVE